MKKKHFYSHLVEFNSLHIELSKLDLSDEQEEHLKELIDSSTHHAILDAILSELSEEDKVIFLEYLAADQHMKVWEHLLNNVDNIEEKIKKVAEDLKKELHKDIEEVKKG